MYGLAYRMRACERRIGYSANPLNGIFSFGILFFSSLEKIIHVILLPLEYRVAENHLSAFFCMLCNVSNRLKQTF